LGITGDVPWLHLAECERQTFFVGLREVDLEHANGLFGALGDACITESDNILERNGVVAMQ
jgi:hypothetical protein